MLLFWIWGVRTYEVTFKELSNCTAPWMVVIPPPATLKIFMPFCWIWMALPLKLLGEFKARYVPLTDGVTKAVDPSCRTGTVLLVVLLLLVVEASIDNNVPLLAITLKMEEVDEEATLKMSLEEPLVPCMLKLTVDEVAL